MLDKLLHRLKLGGFCRGDRIGGNVCASDTTKEADDASRGPHVTEAKLKQSYITVCNQGIAVRRSTYITIAAFCIGLLCLWFMIKQSLPEPVAAESVDEDKHIEESIAQLTGAKAEMFSKVDEMVKKFCQFSNVQQVMVNELRKNPFRKDAAWQDLVEVPESGVVGSGVSYETMRLLSIMRSAGGDCCMIDGKVLYEGDTIGDFVVREIGSNWVKLGSDSTEIVLRLSE